MMQDDVDEQMRAYKKAHSDLFNACTDYINSNVSKVKDANPEWVKEFAMSIRELHAAINYR